MRALDRVLREPAASQNTQTQLLAAELKKLSEMQRANREPGKPTGRHGSVIAGCVWLHPAGAGGTAGAGDAQDGPQPALAPERPGVCPPVQQPSTRHALTRLQRGRGSGVDS